MTPLRAGQYLVLVEAVKVKRARAGHAFVALELLVVRNLEPNLTHSWANYGGNYKTCIHCGVLETESAQPCLRRAVNASGDHVEAVLSSANSNWETNLHDVARACGVLSIEIPANADEGVDTAAIKRARHEHDELLRLTLAPLVGQRAVIDARVAPSRGRRWMGDFMATSWRAPTPLDLCADLDARVARTILAKLWRVLKDDVGRPPGRRCDEALALIESLEVPR